MAMYTMELRTLIDDYGYRIFDDYAFYTDDAKVKEEFEKIFIETYYFYEIGCETPERFKWMLKARLNLIMPYYSQLYLTEWNRVGKDMMNSKDLVETTTHTLNSQQLDSQEQQTTSESKSQSEGSGVETSEANSQATGSGEGTTKSTDLESALENGVPQVHLETDLTRKTQSDSTSSTSTESSTQSDSNSTTSSQASSSNHSSNESSLTNQQQNQLEEKTTFTSKGDIGIQTPAYAITEWRKVLININQQIIDECRDLFMAIY